MKVFTTILKVLAALAAVLGAIYVLATYGDKIVAWAKSVVLHIEDKCCCGDNCTCDCAEEAEVTVAEDADFEG